MITITISVLDLIIFLLGWTLIGVVWIITFKNSDDTIIPIPAAISFGPILFILYFREHIRILKQKRKEKLSTLKGQREIKLKKLKRKSIFGL